MGMGPGRASGHVESMAGVYISFRNVHVTHEQICDERELQPLFKTFQLDIPSLVAMSQAATTTLTATIP
jgi:hypothetical protein